MISALREGLTKVIYIKAECACVHTQPCLTLWDPMDCSLPGYSVRGIFQARILEWVAIYI